MRRTAYQAGTLALALWLLVAAPAGALESNTPTNSSVLPVVVAGAEFPGLIGESPLKLSAISCAGGSPKPIRFQVDDVNAKGDVVAPDATDELEPDEQPGLIDETDELVLMLADLGGPCSAGQLAKMSGRVFAIELAADYLKAPAHAYLLLSERGYVPSGAALNYDPKTHTVKTSSYLWGYRPENPFHYDRMAYTDIQGSGYKDIFDRLKVRFTVRPVGGLVTLHVDADEFDSRLLGMRVGPVRGVRELALEIEAVPGFAVPVRITFVHYERMWVAKVRFTMPGRAALFTSSMDFKLLHDFTDFKGLTFSTSALAQGSRIDGQMIEIERSLEFGPEPWYFLSGRGLNQVTVVELDPNLKLTAAAVLIDSETAGDPPEDVPGGLPSIGYQFLGMEDLEARTYRFSAHIGVLPGFPERGGTGFYRTIKAPMRVKVRPVRP